LLEVTNVFKDGLENSFDWHRDKQVKERKQAGDYPNDRAILIQTRENLENLKKIFPKLESFDKDSCFGENFTVEGCLEPTKLCVGDILYIKRNDKLVCTLQITSPRWPCYKIDIKHSKTLVDYKFEEKVRAQCVDQALAGFFCKVIEEGTVKAGDSLVVGKRTHPEWTLSRTAQLLYGGENKKNCRIDKFQGTEEELKDLINLEDLATFEWKDRLIKYLEKRETQKIEDEKKKIEDEKKAIEDEKKSKIFRQRILYIVIFLLLIPCFSLFLKNK